MAINFLGISACYHDNAAALVRDRRALADADDGLARISPVAPFIGTLS
ncbi:MAG: hypothetical protein ACLFQI_02210 [Halochromatium sp.]